MVQAASLFNQLLQHFPRLEFRLAGQEALGRTRRQRVYQQFDPARGPLGRWVLSVARNRAIDHLRSWEGRMARGAFPIHEWDQPSAAGDFENDLLSADLIRALRVAMTKLSGRQQAILNLAYVEGLTQMEMAERLKRPFGTIKTWVRAALQALRAEMEPYGERAI